MCYLLIEAGYFIGIVKSQLVPSTWVRFLGFICDSVRQAFLIPEDKTVKSAALREDISSSHFVALKTLQRFSGSEVEMIVPLHQLPTATSLTIRHLRFINDRTSSRFTSTCVIFHVAVVYISRALNAQVCSRKGMRKGFFMVKDTTQNNS